MADEIIKELWSVKDKMASDHNYDLNKLVAYLRAASDPARYEVVDLRASKVEAEQLGPERK